MADTFLKVPTTGEPVPAAVVEDSQAAKNLLSVIEALGDSMSNADRAKYEGLLERARSADAAQSK